jgi:hypothetical protein
VVKETIKTHWGKEDCHFYWRFDGSTRIPRIEPPLHTWISNLYQAIENTVKIEAGTNGTLEEAVLFPPSVRITMLSDETVEYPSTDPVNELSFEVSVVKNRRITSPDWFQEVRHIELESDGELWCAIA